MKVVQKNAKKALATLLFFFALFVQADPVFSVTENKECTCNSPAVSITNQTSNSVSFSWDAVVGSSAFKVWYVRREDSFTSQEYTVNGLSTSFTNLSPGTYKFYFYTDCGESGTSEIIITDDLMMT